MARKLLKTGSGALYISRPSSSTSKSLARQLSVKKAKNIGNRIRSAGSFGSDVFNPKAVSKPAIARDVINRINNILFRPERCREVSLAHGDR